MKNLSNYELIIFDLDGTLYFQRALQITMGCLLLKHFFLGKKGKDELNIVLTFRKKREISTDNTNAIDEKIFNELAEKFGEDIQYIKQVIDEWMFKKPLKYIAKYRDKEIISIIKKLQQSDKNIAILSDYETEDKKKALGLDNIKSFYSLDSKIGALKPSPKGIIYIMAYFGIEDKSKVIIVGDRMSKDGQAAINAGIDYLILKKYKLMRKY